MIQQKEKIKYSYRTVMHVIGVCIIILLAVALLWHGNATSSQASMAMMAQVYFDGEYRIADGPWQPIVKGEHIPATKGDVTLRGNFHMLAPDGEYVGIYTDEIPIALYLNHISLTITEGDNEPNAMEMENPLFGKAACGADWRAYYLVNKTEEPIEILIHNPHSFGNETAIDQMLSTMELWAEIIFEKGIMEAEEPQRTAGLFFITVSLAILGIALFSTLIHLKNSKILWLFGLVIAFAGAYLSYNISGITF